MPSLLKCYSSMFTGFRWRQWVSLLAIYYGFFLGQVQGSPISPVLMVSMNNKSPDAIEKHVENIEQAYNSVEPRDDTNSTSSDTVGTDARQTMVKLWRIMHQTSFSLPQAGVRDVFDLIPTPSKMYDIPVSESNVVAFPHSIPISTAREYREDKAKLDNSPVAMERLDIPEGRTVTKRRHHRYKIFRLIRPNSNVRFNFGRITIDPIYYFMGLGR